jgi:hypothetical protein
MCQGHRPHLKDKHKERQKLRNSKEKRPKKKIEKTTA